MRGVNMAPGASKTQPPKARKRVDVDPSLLKRSDDGGAFAHCEKCNQDIAVATFDMHDCLNATMKILKWEKRVHLLDIFLDRVGGKRKGDAKGIAGKPAKLPKVKAKKPSKKAAKDPSVPKRPASGFFIFM
ncbi:unnamed protein product [Sphagnum jensenii]|uniref:Uncharacterized protein n=1 Tax=Sphagnum jensenii TaxID=128206 RepID=A0ABP0VCD0_9BRYO